MSIHRHNFRRLAVVLGIGLGALFLGAEGRAASVTLTYQGMVNSVESPLNTEFSLGDIFTFSYTFDPDATDTNSDTTIGDYAAGVTSYSVTIGSYTATGGPGVDRFSVTDSPGGDSYVFNDSSPSGPALSGFDPDSFQLVLADSTGNAFSDDSLPAALPDPSLFDSIAFMGLIFVGAGGESEAAVDAIGNLSAVPLPAALPLLASALAGFGFFGWRRTQKVAA